FNPLHNGHKYLLERARAESGCDFILCVMSGCFTQRGDMCRTDKFLRAKHAILSGADAVIELPTPFAVAPAEIFARGAIEQLKGINGEITLAFGCESGTADDFTGAARVLNAESEIFKRRLAEYSESGESYIRSYSAAFKACGGNEEFISSPNNILGVEYAKSVLRAGLDVTLLPIKRVGAGYNDCGLCGNYSSASGIRANADNPAIKDNMPDYSYYDFIASPDRREKFETLAVDWLYLCDKENLKRVYGCTEGLENRLKKLTLGNGYNQIIDGAASKRYSKTRIRRILTANLLGLYADETQKLFDCSTPKKILAVKKSRADEILPLLSDAEETDEG
ncbi:MAG: nucleotidyltransferase family protein, partial [Clostridia bacterium]|nr:nucleotidyltransferase family protein [Clostridia bacterium]